ncbi:hypothetical protein SAMN05216299_1172 [Nitrosospira sp. Nsp14]|nr:hypothetical protein SAMN05216299_1172 [Nitrosospira sp. Nsp14]
MVITCGEFFEFREYISPNSFGILNKLDHYTLLEFGHRRRFELIKRWANLGGNIHPPEKTIALIDQMEKLVTSVIGAGVVPSTPFFMLTLLQTLEAGSPTDLQHSALGDYYRYLIIHSLEVQHVSREEHAEILNYCAHLGWFVSQTPSQKISTTDFQQFHHQFTERHGLSLDFTHRSRLLAQAKLFEQCDDGFGFVFPYLYYFFLGKYLAEHLDTEEINQFIRKCCLSLHNPDCSNTVLFLAHHSRDKRVYEGILFILQTHFAKCSPVNLDNDVDVVNGLVKSTPNLIYIQSDPLENRTEIRNLQDKTEAKRQELMPDSETLPPEFVALISLLKTIDILGQFLKNHYGQLEAQVKEQLIKELFDGAFRGLRYFLELLVQDSEWLIQSIEKVIEKRGLEDDQLKRNARAKKETFELLGMIVTAFIRRCGISVASPHLARIIERVIVGNPTTIYRLVLSAIDLEYQGGLKDLSKLRDLNQDIKNNSLAQWILRQLVLAHMHLYSTTHIQKQRVCAELSIDIHNQRLVELETKDSKRVAH